MIHRIWLQQPLAFARVGTSETPLDAFEWTHPDLRPRDSDKGPYRSGRTAIAPAESFDVDPDGAARRRPSSDITEFSDKESRRLRPVCPFFELHGEWEEQGQAKSGALTPGVLRANGRALGDLTWSIHHANLKAYVLTHSEGDRVEACLTIPGDQHDRRRLIGRSPNDGKSPPLVLPPPACGIEMGALQVLRPVREDDKIRLRFYAPKGHTYAPQNLAERISRRPLLDRILGGDWGDFSLPSCRCILNPEADWPNYKFIRCRDLWKEAPRLVRQIRLLLALWPRATRSECLRLLLSPTADAGKLPPSLFAWHYGGGALFSSLGMLDDLGDGIIQCSLADLPRPGFARIIVCPPHFAPDRRPPVSIADNLTDRAARADVRAADWASHSDAEAEIDDLFDRAFETAGLSNLDVWNKELRQDNRSSAIFRNEPDRPVDPGALLWSDLDRDSVVDLPLTERARWYHRRNAADEFFEQFVRDTPDFVERFIRNPDDGQALYYDRRMPALMRGPDRYPLHLTRRQLEALRKWTERLRKSNPCRPEP